MFSFDNYLFSLLVVLVPVFIYFAFFFKRDYFKKDSAIIAVFCISGIVFFMSYPLELTPGYIFDMRTIPWLLAFLYGGVRIGLLSTVVLFGYRMFIGFDEGLLIVLISYFLSGAVILIFLKRFNAGDLNKRLIISAFLTLINNFTILLAAFLLIGDYSRHGLPELFPYFLLTHLVTILLVVFIIEALKEKEENKIRLQKIEKIKLVGEMAAAVAHEIRNPLTVVKGFTQLFRNDENLTDKQKSSLELMDSELVRAEKIISDYLTLARSESKQQEPIDVREILANTVKVIEPYAVLNDVIIANQLDRSYYIYGNRSDVGQVFLNMIKNGIEAIEGKGHVTIGAREMGQNVEIDIRDSGRGMNEDEISRLGTPFYTTKDQGTGLGTMVCFKMIDDLKGKFDVKSNVGKGTTITITLPLMKKGDHDLTNR